MSANTRGLDRSPFEVARFIIGVVGFFTAATGLVVSSIGASIIGLFLLLLSVGSFALQGD
jgi:hypothetical protein